ncbi:hypothetical protein N2W54_001646 [Lotmaria passim]
MRNNDVFSSFFASSLANLKAQSPKEKSTVTDPTAEEQLLLRGTSFGTFSIPFDTFRRANGNATSLYRHSSLTQMGGERDPTTATAVSTTATTTTVATPYSLASAPVFVAEDGVSTMFSSPSSSSFERGQKICREPYANCKGVSVLGERWGSGAYDYGNSGRALQTTPTKTATKAPAITARADVALPAIVTAPKCPPRRTVVAPIRTVKASTPSAIEVDFSCDDDDQPLPDENKTQQFFRLAQQHRDQRMRLIKKHKREQRRRNRAKTQAPAANKTGDSAAAASLPLPPSSPQQPSKAHDDSIPAAKDSVQPPNYRVPHPPFFAAPAAHDARHSFPSSDGGYILDNDGNDYLWLIDDNFQAAESVVKKEDEAEAEADDSTSSSSSTSASSDSKASSSAESILLEERELWGVCPRRDFPMVKSPVWAMLDGPQHHGGESTSCDDDASLSGDASALLSGRADAVQDHPEDFGEVMELVVTTTLPPVESTTDSSQHLNESTTPAGTTTAPALRSEVSMHALKIRHNPDTRLTDNSSHVTMNSTANLSDSPEAPSNVSSRSSSASLTPPPLLGSCEATTKVAVQHRPLPPRTSPGSRGHEPSQLQQSEEVRRCRQEVSIAKVENHPRTPPRMDVGPAEPRRYRRANRFRRIFKGLL